MKKPSQCEIAVAVELAFIGIIPRKFVNRFVTLSLAVDAAFDEQTFRITQQDERLLVVILHFNDRHFRPSVCLTNQSYVADAYSTRDINPFVARHYSNGQSHRYHASRSIVNRGRKMSPLPGGQVPFGEI